MTKTAADIMTSDVLSVTPDSLVADAAELILKNRITALPVVDEEGHLQGFIGESELVRAAEAEKERRGTWWLARLAAPTMDLKDLFGGSGKTVEEVMSRDILLVSENDTLQKLAAMLSMRNTKALPVVRDGKLTGIVSRIDILRYLAKERTML